MLEVSNEVLAGLGAYLGKDGISKILGPTAEYLGNELKSYAQKRIGNVGKILSNTEKKLGRKVDSPGRVPPKVLKTIINEGSYADDDIAVEYFGGVLASSRTVVERDDRGARLAKLIDGMSAYQIRAHYLMYSTISELFSNTPNSFDLQENRKKMELFFPIQDYYVSMGFTQEEFSNPQILNHIFHGLATDGLIDSSWRFGPQSVLNEYVSGVPSSGIVCVPSAFGVELLLWAFGHGDKELNFLLTGDYSGEIKGIPKSVTNSIATKDFKGQSS